MKRNAFALLFFSCSVVLLQAQTVQPFPMQWHASFGGASNDYMKRIVVTRDRGYIVAGDSSSGISGSKQTTNYGKTDWWVVRLDQNGNKVWERDLGGTDFEQLGGLKHTSDDGFILVGSSYSGRSGNKTSQLYGEADYWVVKLDGQGNVMWDKSYGGSGLDEAVDVVETDDQGFVVIGDSHSGTNEIKTSANLGSADAWILRLNAQGDLIWQTNYGTASVEWPYAVDRYGTNGFVIAGAAPPTASANFDFWILAIDQTGKKLWERFYGGDDTDQPFCIQQTADGGFIVCGWTDSGVSGNKTTPLVGSYGLDCWVVRLNSTGDKLWERTFGHDGTDYAQSTVQTIDGGFVLAAGSFLLNVPWLIRLDASGNLVWQQTYPVAPGGAIKQAQLTDDGGLVAAGSMSSPLEGGNALIVKWAPDALIAPQLQLTRAANESRIQLRGIAGRSYVVETSSDFQAWSPFATNTLATNTIEVVDPGTTPLAFYRAMMLP